MSGTRDNSGSLSKNDRKTEDRHPDIRGSAVINGVSYWISGWQKENDRGKWYSLSFQPKDQQSQQEAPRQNTVQNPRNAGPTRGSIDDDPLPF